jgi:hypothetical protein
VKPSSHSFERFTDADWAAIQRAAQARKDCPLGINWTEIRVELEQAGRDFWRMRRRRLRRPEQLEQEHLRQLIKQVQDLDVAFPALGQKLKVLLGPALRFMMAWNELLQIWASKYFQRRSDEHRELLYQRVRMMWTGLLGGTLGTSTDSFGEKRIGPFVRFFTAVTQPILGSEALSPEGINKMVRREHDRLEAYKIYWGGRRYENPTPPESHVIFDEWTHYI